MTNLSLPAWLPFAVWPLLVVLALGGASAGGAIAVASVVVAVAAGAVLVYAASGEGGQPDLDV